MTALSPSGRIKLDRLVLCYEANNLLLQLEIWSVMLQLKPDSQRVITWLQHICFAQGSWETPPADVTAGFLPTRASSPSLHRPFGHKSIIKQAPRFSADRLLHTRVCTIFIRSFLQLPSPVVFFPPGVSTHQLLFQYVFFFN